MTRAALTGIGDVPRRWTRRVGTIAGILLLYYALYRAALGEQQTCNYPKHPRPGVGYACDVGPPVYPHTVLWLLLVATAVVALVAVRRLFAEEA